MKRDRMKEFKTIKLMFIYLLVSEPVYAKLRSYHQLQKIDSQRKLVSIKSYGGNPKKQHYPLGLCEGDCDIDDDCDVGLVCFQRERNDSIPGCEGGLTDSSRTDYCIADTILQMPSQSPSFVPSKQPSSTPTEIVSESSIKPSFQPSDYPSTRLNPESSNPSLTPSLMRSDQPSSLPTEIVSEPSSKPSFRPSSVPSKSSKPSYSPSDQPSPATSQSQQPSSTPFDQPSHLPSASSQLPSLDPSHQPSSKPSTNPSIMPSQEPSLSLHPTEMDPQLSSMPSEKPTQSGQPSETPSTAPSLLVEPSSKPSMSLIPSNSVEPSFEPSQMPSPPLTPGTIKAYPGPDPPPSAYPLGLCEGDCDFDSDCEGELTCFKRSNYDPVPGCNGGLEDGSRNDYCIIPPTSGPVPPPTANFFRMKLFWQEGYFWQEEEFERKWCMKCKDECIQGNPLWITECSSDSTYFGFVEIDSDHILIEVSGTILCLERFELDIFLQVCDPISPLQQWYASNGTFTGEKFEIRQDSEPLYCISQHHHPKFGEEVEMQRCANAQFDETNFWNRY